MAKIIGISGISGAGTTTITKALGDALGVTTVFLDDFDDISKSPSDYVEWFHESKDYADWHYPALEKVLAKLRAGHSLKHPVTKEDLLATPLIIFDGPLGRKHQATSRHVDFFIHIDTSMDVALARRLIRDYSVKMKSPCLEIIDELSWYLDIGRPLFDASEIKASADFVTNGDVPVDEVLSSIMVELEKQNLP